MLSVDVKTALRRIKHDVKTVIVKVIGLILGLSVFCTVLLFLSNELNYNKSVKNKENIYRVLNINETDGAKWANTPLALKKALLNSSPDIKNAMSYRIVDKFELNKNGEYIEEEHLLCTSSSFFKMFSIDVLGGSVQQLDHDENQIIISKSVAQKYFGETNVIGKPLKMRVNGEELDLFVAAVFKDIPNNSSLNQKIIANTDVGLKLLLKSMASLGQVMDMSTIKNGWQYGIFFTNLIQVSANTPKENVANQLNKIALEHSTDDNKLNFSMQSFTDVYFKSDKDLKDNNNLKTMSWILVFTCACIGLFSLLIAIINYITLELSKTNTQVQSYGVRKIFGANRLNSTNSYALENFIIFFISFLLAIYLSHLLLPTLSPILGKDYSLSFGDNKIVVWLALAIVFALAAVMGYIILPGRFSVFSISESLYGGKIGKQKSFNISSALVIFQIVVFIVCTASALVIKKQVRFSLNQNLGFEKEGLLCINRGDKDYQLFKNAIANNANVMSVSAAFQLPPYYGGMSVTLHSDEKPDKPVSLGGIFVDYNFIETLNFEIIEGDSFKKEGPSKGVIVSESAVKAMEYESPIGQDMGFGPIIGVVNDFSEHSVHTKARPVMLILNPSGVNEIAVKVNTANLQETIKSIEKKWNKLPGTTPFKYEFVDDKLAELYQSMIGLNKILNWSALITIFIACLGLYGLSIFTTRQRNKEIGIRKVNGAKISEILTMLNLNFVKWVVIAFVIACPIAYYAMSKWLENFAYKTNLSWWIFVLAGLLALGIALLTVSWQSWRAATRNPVEVLKHE